MSTSTNDIQQQYAIVMAHHQQQQQQAQAQAAAVAQQQQQSLLVPSSVTESGEIVPIQQSSAASSSSPVTNNNVNGMNSSQQPTKIEIRCIVDNTAVGGIIGNGGNSVRQVREESQAFVSIVKAEFRHVQERIMILKGTVEQIATATKGIAALLIDANSRREERTVETAQLRLLVHKTAVGAIIGKGGESIRLTQSETGCRVQVSNETLPSSSEKTVTLTGTAPQMSAAMARIATQLIQNPLKPNTKVYPYVPGNQVYAAPPNTAYGTQVGFQPNGQNLHLYHPTPSNPGLPSNQFGGLIRPQPPAASMMSTQKIAIPTICCGSIIGKNGVVIKSIRDTSQTNISISDPDAATPNERVVTLNGTPTGISHAVFLIRQLVEAYQPNANGNTQTNTNNLTNQLQQQQQQQQTPQY